MATKPTSLVIGTIAIVSFVRSNECQFCCTSVKASITMCPNYILEFRNSTTHLMLVFLGASANTKSVIEFFFC